MTGDFSPLFLHYVMFIPTLHGQATEEQQAKWLPLAFSAAIVGTYAQTELGHGTNVQELETTATYDPKTEEFVLNSPTLTATKWWVGNLGKSSNYAIVIAQLWTKGQKHGTHSFIVQIRDENTHTVLPGINVGDIGPKFGFASMDNGFLQLANVRVPRENMLMKNGKVLPNGEYVAPSTKKLGYGSMVFVRSVLVLGVASDLAQAATVAIRYSVIRHQGELTPGKGETKILNYQTQQYRLFPELAKAYCFLFAGKSVRDTYMKVAGEIQNGNIDLLPELHALSSGVKAYTTWAASQGIEQCRLACGGHGYLLVSGLPELYANNVAGCTYEGDNIVLLLQTARFLINTARRIVAGGDRRKLSESAQYIQGKDGGSSGLDQTLKNEDLVEALEHVARRKIREGLATLSQMKARGYSSDEAWNTCGIQLCKMARAHIRVYLAKSFTEQVRNASCSQATRLVLDSLCRLFILHTVSNKSGQFLEDNFLSSQQLCYIRQGICDTLKNLRPNAVALVDAFQFSDRQLKSVLGRNDGWVYENLMESVKYSSLNETEVMECHHGLLGQMMREAKSKL